MDAAEAKRNGKDADNLAPGFRISGLGQLIEAGIQADRLVTFGD
jgi:tRNA 2-thiouridine synthesizing protein D